MILPNRLFHPFSISGSSSSPARQVSARNGHRARDFGLHLTGTQQKCDIPSCSDYLVGGFNHLEKY